MIVRNDLEPEPSLYSMPDTKVCAAYEAIKQCGARCQVAHETGHPAQVIIGFADAHNSDLIVMGSRGRGAFKSMLLGSVSSRVMHYASKSVMIVH
jgi:nucleotide-binding universal stress UspA family protein